jgi:TetR/AcrR family transcriptional regulator
MPTPELPILLPPPLRSRRSPRHSDKPRPQTGDTTKQNILNAATIEFAEHGFRGCSTRKIAVRAAVPQGLLRYYFGNKENLWKAVIEALFVNFHNAMTPLSEKRDPEQRLDAAIRNFIQYTAKHPEHAQLMQQEGKSPGPRLDWLVKTFVDPLSQNLDHLIQAVQQQNKLPPAPPLFLHYILNGATQAIFMLKPEYLRLSGKKELSQEDIDTYADVVVKLVLR